MIFLSYQEKYRYSSYEPQIFDKKNKIKLFSQELTSDFQ